MRIRSHVYLYSVYGKWNEQIELYQSFELGGNFHEIETQQGD